MAISAAMIVKNEAGVLGTCLAALDGVVDEIVVVDTGSTDDTVAMAQRFSPHVHGFPWRDDFASARNFALDRCRSEWVLVVDADEVLDNRAEARALLERFIATHGAETVGDIEIVNAVGRGADAGEAVDRTRRFFSRAHFRFAGAIHEQLVPTSAFAPRDAFTGVRLLHSGYAQAPDDPRHKALRNLRLIARELNGHPDDEYLHYQAGKAHFSVKRYAEAIVALEAALRAMRFSGPMPPQGKLGPVSRKVLTDALTTLAYAYANTGQLEQAEALLTQHAALGHAGTARADFWYALGYTRLMCGKIAASRDAFARALALGADQEDVRGTGGYGAMYHLGLLCEAEQDIAGAHAWYRRALEMKPGYAPAAARIAAT